jgi:hypothetical protein
LLLPKEQRRPMPKPPSNIGSGAFPGSKGGKMSQAEIDAQNEAAYEQYKDNLSPCPNCGRRFNGLLF